MSVQIEDAHLTYRSRRTSTQALAGLDLSVADGELVAVMGPSGSGKSSLLYVIAGLESLDRGRIAVGGVDVTDRPPQRRDVALVFQDLALYPHLDVRDNVALDLEAGGARRSDARARAEQIAPAFALGGLLDRRPGTLSGGERQRVALARALAREPQLLLLDEPVAHLDAPLRAQARREIVGHQRWLGISCLYVTHDGHEAMAVGDRIAVLHEGRVLQCASPDELYDRPRSAQVARRIGDPPMNVLRGSMVGVRGAEFGVHAHHLHLTSAGAGDIDAEIADVERRGREALVVSLMEDGERISVLVPADRRPVVGERVGIRIEKSGLWLFPGSDP